MTQPEAAVGDVPSDTIVAGEPSLEERLATIMDEPEAADETAEGEAPDATEPEAEIALDDEPDDEADEEPPIAPPVSWTDEEKEEFKALPPEAQKVIARREAEREKFVQAKAQEASKTRAMVEQQAMQQIQQQNATFVQQLQALLPQIPEEPSAHLLVEDPTRYANEKDERNWALAQHDYIMQQVRVVAQQQGQLQQQQQARANALNEAMLKEQFPEFLDTEKGPDLKKSLRATGIALGYSDDQLALVDAQDILAMKAASEWKAKADKLDTLMAKQMEKVRAAKTLPKVSRPGVAVGKGVINQQRYEADRQAMRRGDSDAAARAIARFL